MAPIRQSKTRGQHGASRVRAGRRGLRSEPRFARQVRKLLLQVRDLPFRELVVHGGHLVLRIKSNGTRLRRYGELIADFSTSRGGGTMFTAGELRKEL